MRSNRTPRYTTAVPHNKKQQTRENVIPRGKNDTFAAVHNRRVPRKDNAGKSEAQGTSQNAANNG